MKKLLCWLFGHKGKHSLIDTHGTNELYEVQCTRCSLILREYTKYIDPSELL